MQPLNYILTLLITFLGLGCGATLALLAEEELSTGKKYFIMIKHFLLVVIVAMFLYFFDLNRIIAVMLVIIVFILLYMSNVESHFIYAFLSFIFFFSHFNQKLLVIESALIFLYGFPEGSLFVIQNLKKKKLDVIKSLVTSHGSYFIIGIVLFLLLTFSEYYL